MLKVANRKNLKENARILLGVNHTSELEKELIKACEAGFQRAHGHISHDRARHLEQLNKILGTFGVEGSIDPDIQYCNTGETYAITLLYWQGKLRIGDWGCIAESCLV